jgi:hypothetical protein
MLPKCELAPLALDNDPKKIATLRLDIIGLGERVIVRGRKRGSLSVIHEHISAAWSRTGARPTTTGVSPPPHILQHAEERQIRHCAI